MVTTQKTLRRTIMHLSVAAFAFTSLGVAIAAPMFKAKLVVEHQVLRPLAGGPAIQLAKAGPGVSEDCVRVTRMIGPDGREYPTNGVVCGGE